MNQRTTPLQSIDTLGAMALDAPGGQPSVTPPADATVAAIASQFPANWLVIRNGKASDVAAQLPGLNVALTQDVLSIQVPAQLVHDGIVGLLFIDDTENGAGMSHARVVIELQAGSAVNIIEYHSTIGNAMHHAHCAMELSLAAGARCNFIRFQDRQTQHDQTGSLTATLDMDSQLHHTAFDLGGNVVRNELNIKLAGAGAMTCLYGLFMAGGDQHVENHSRVDHLVGPASSEQEYRGIAAGASRCVWRGVAVVHRGADGTNASQANHNLLLSAAAIIDATPQLEIYADDVKASHGTTFGGLDQNALFYLRTRGLDDAAARRLLIGAHAGKIVARSPLPALQARISEIVAQRVATLIAEEAP
ncbi:MAG: Fe-S cluster assembly protein SufD [Gammaproteobacteria bacterium]|nr:Fe-S cluster assembly protein SufD [Gammaproteobacteria bacterium]MDH5302945.1 Fe-S cluster assembly protein SufD [Gammaproteobacteria bacterium]MDH5321141.1 Fe-S cluster assembly protein SufD [Gammaproteobacteria bacterium]